jgi:hypothetical protein
MFLPRDGDATVGVISPKGGLLEELHLHFYQI